MFWVVIVLIICALSAYWWLFGKGDSPLDSLPGPKPLPILGNVDRFINATREGMFLQLRDFNKKYGDIFLVRILGRRIIHISNPNYIELVLSHSRNIEKSKPYSFIEPWLGRGLLLSSGAKWHGRRKILTPTFHFNILKNFATIIEEQSRTLVQELKAECDKSETAITPLISNFTLHTICETAMGTQLDVDKSKASLEYKNAILDIGEVLLQRVQRFWLHSDWIFERSKRGKLFKEYLSTLRSFTENVIKERKEKMTKNDELSTLSAIDGEEVLGKKRRLAMLDLLLVAEQKGEIDIEGIQEEVDTFMFEGHDTTAMALTFGLMLLANHQDIQEKVYEECRTIFGDSGRQITMSDLSNMKYLEACIKETLRLYPSVPFVARKITEDFEMGGVTVTAGTEVGVNIFELHRRSDQFPEPNLFRPERFLMPDAVKHPYGYIPFSAGPRNCIGQRFAMQEMKCVVGEIVRNYQLSPGTKPEELSFIAEMVLRPAKPVYVKFRPRLI